MSDPSAPARPGHDPSSHRHGGSFLLSASSAAETRTREDLTDEHHLVIRTVDEFWHREVESQLPAIHRLEPGAARSVLRKSADLGLTSMHLPEAFGGSGADLTTCIAVVERLSEDASYIGWHVAHCGLGMLPILYFGTPAQQQQYLPRLASVELLGAYALTEPQSGSDALAVRTRADLTPDGRHYVINGQKMWITNGAEADLFTVFAKVGGEAFTAFLVERQFGVRHGAEEEKMGLHGTSTTAVYFDNVMVPAENVLGGIGQGHRIAFNTLNSGRLKLGPLALGCAKRVLGVSLAYAAQRPSFGTTISAFGAVRQKLADSAVRIFAVESATWRLVGLIETCASELLTRTGCSGPAAELAAFEEYAAECSMIKVTGSEMLDAVADHGVQVHGGFGFHRDYFVERAYRDSRVNRIFEGTNEINRLLIPGLVLKRAARAGSSLLEAAADVFADHSRLAGARPAGSDDEVVARTRTIALLLLGAAHRRHGDALRDQQEVTMHVADAMMELFVMESARLRATKLAASAPASQAPALCTVYLRDGLARVAHAAERVLPAVLAPDTARAALAAVRAAAGCEPIDIIGLHQGIARRLLERGQYVVG